MQSAPEIRPDHTNMIKIFLILASILALGSSTQAENAVFTTPTHIQHLKKLIYILSEPKFDFKANAKDKDIDHILDYIGDLRFTSPDAQSRAARQISELIKNVAKKIKDAVTKVKEPFEQLSSKIKDFFAKFTEPFKKLFKPTEKPAGKKSPQE